MIIKLLKVFNLTKSFVSHDADAGGQIQASHPSPHRDRISLLQVGQDERVGKAGGFASENQEITTLEIHLGIKPVDPRTEKMETAMDESAAQSIEIRPALDGNRIPVIQAGSFEEAAFQTEAERFHQVQAAAGGGTKAGHVTGVGRDARFHQDDMQWCFLI